MRQSLLVAMVFLFHIGGKLSRKSHFCVDKYVSRMYCVQLPFFLFVLKTIVTSAVLTSNVERGGSHLACPGQVVVLTCSETGTYLLNWISVTFSPDILYSPEGTEEVRMGFTANLTEAINDDSVLRMTFTLTFTFTDSLAMDGLTVECRTRVNSQTIIRMASVEMTGTYVVENTTACTGQPYLLYTYLHSPTIFAPVPTAQCVWVWGGWSLRYCRVDVP